MTLRCATYARDFRYTSSRRLRQHHRVVNPVTGVETTGTNYCNLRIFGIASPGAAAGTFDPTQTLVRTGGSGPYHQNSWGVQDIASANADFHVGGFHNVTIVGIDAGYQRADRTIYAYTLPDPATYTYALSPPGTNIAVACAISAFRCSTTPISRRAGYAPILPTPTNLGSDTATSVLYSTGEATDPALFATDRFWFTDEISLIAGLRIDQYRANYTTTTVGTVANPYPVTKLKAPSFLFDPRASLV